MQKEMAVTLLCFCFDYIYWGSFKSIFYKAVNLFQYDCVSTLVSIPGTNPVLSNEGKVVGNNGLQMKHTLLDYQSKLMLSMQKLTSLHQSVVLTCQKAYNNPD